MLVKIVVRVTHWFSSFLEVQKTVKVPLYFVALRLRSHRKNPIQLYSGEFATVWTKVRLTSMIM